MRGRVPSSHQQSDKACARRWFGPSSANAAMLTCGDLGNKQRGLGNVSATRYISRMAKGKRETEWEVIRLKATPAALVGLVQAPDKATALKAAIDATRAKRGEFRFNLGDEVIARKGSAGDRPPSSR